jgi:hypothetical protein
MHARKRILIILYKLYKGNANAYFGIGNKSQHRLPAGLKPHATLEEAMQWLLPCLAC